MQQGFCFVIEYSRQRIIMKIQHNTHAKQMTSCASARIVLDNTRQDFILTSLSTEQTKILVRMWCLTTRTSFFLNKKITRSNDFFGALALLGYTDAGASSEILLRNRRDDLATGFVVFLFETGICIYFHHSKTAFFLRHSFTFR